MRHAAVVLLLAACGTAAGSSTGAGAGTSASATTTTTTSTARAPLPAGRVVDGCFVTDDAPDPLACITSDDCVAGALFLPATCCMSGVTHPHSSAYHAWQSELFARHCDGTCVHPPSPPLDCEVAVRCVEGRCRNTCDLPTGDGALDAMDESELEAACARGVSAACDRLGH